MDSGLTVCTIILLYIAGVMMSAQLLDRINRVSRFLRNGTGFSIDTDELCHIFGKLIKSDIIVADDKGVILGIYDNPDVSTIDYLDVAVQGDVLNEDINERIMSVLSTRENVHSSMLGIESEEYEQYEFLIIPIDISGERLGTILTYRINNQYEVDDIILGEYVTTIVSLELLHGMRDDEENAAQKRKQVGLAIHSLSHSEIYAAYCALSALKKTKGILIVSRVAGEYGITRSAIVNSIKKLNSAGVIKSKSMGVKGTAIIIQNEYIMEALASRIPEMSDN